MVSWIALRDAWLNGDIRAYNQLAEEIRKAGYRAAFRLLKNHFDSDDVATQTFLRINPRLPTFYNELGFRAYVNTTARHLVIDMKRPIMNDMTVSIGAEGDDQPGPQLVEPSQGALAGLIEQESIERRRAELQFCLAQLSKDERRVIILRLDGYSNEQIAELLKIPYGTVGRLVSDGKEKLQKCLAKSEKS